MGYLDFLANKVAKPSPSPFGHLVYFIEQRLHRFWGATLPPPLRCT